MGQEIVEEALAQRFTNVIYTNVYSDYRRYSHEYLIVKPCPAEDRLGLIHGPGSADMITAAEYIPYTNSEKAISAFSMFLRPRGTLAIWFSGRPIFTGENHEKIQAIFNKITSKSFESARPLINESRQRACHVLSNWLDTVAFPTSDWECVKRIKWNYDQPLSFVNDSELGFEIGRESKIEPEEKLSYLIDRELWAEERGIEWVKGFVRHVLPWGNQLAVAPRLGRLYSELAEAMGGTGSTRKVTWPVVLILATKK
ncbi:hypothetical protein MMC20_000792 [Loxospora ochrophaea]|nr:hypothetical protein [Loxospora ochrophaea]